MNKKTAYVEKLTVKFYCPKCEKIRIRTVNKWDLSATETDPDIGFGTHGSIDVDVTCPECKKQYSLELRDW